MMRHSIFGIALGTLFAKKQRLILTCIGVAVSFGLIIVISVLYTSMEQSVQKTIDNEYGTFDLMVGYSPYNKTDKLLTKNEITHIRNMDGVIDSGVAIVSPELVTPEQNETARENSINYFAVEPNKLIRDYYGFTAALHPDEVVITEGVARSWNVKKGDSKEFNLNKDIVLNKRVAEVIPEYQSGSAVIMNIDAVRQKYSLGEVANTVYLKLADHISDTSVAAKIRSKVNENINISLRSQDNDVVKQRTMLRFIAIGVGSLLMLVTVLFISSSFKLMLIGRVRELSIFRMIGASKRVVYKLVMIEAAVLNLLGTLLGVCVGFLLCQIAGRFINSMMGIKLNNVEMNWKIVVVISVLGWTLLTLSVMRNAIKASSSAPLVAIRYSEQEKVGKSIAWLAGILMVIGLSTLCLAWLNLIKGDTKLLFTLMGGLLSAGGCILSTGYLIPGISRVIGWFIHKSSIPEAYYAMKQFGALRRQNSFIVMLLASIVTAFIAIPTFIDNLNHSNTEEVLRKHMTPIVIVKKLGVMSSQELAQVRQVEGVSQALPVGSFQSVLLANMDYEKANPKWLKLKRYHPEYLKGVSLYETYEYEWIGIAETDLKLMKQMGLIKLDQSQSSFGIVIQPEYAAHMGLELGETLSLQRTSLGKKLDQYDLPISGVTGLPFTTQEALALVDVHNSRVSWIGEEENEKNEGIMPKTIYVQVSKGADIAGVRSSLQELFKNDPMIKVTDRDSELLRVAKQSKEQYTILWAVMAVFVIVGIVGIINTLGATFHSHRREYAILRAIRLTTERLKAVMIIQGLLYAITAVVIGVAASVMIIVGLFSGSDEFGGWTISWFAIVLPIFVVGIISFTVSLLCSKQLGLKAITEELKVE